MWRPSTAKLVNTPHTTKCAARTTDRTIAVVKHCAAERGWHVSTRVHVKNTPDEAFSSKVWVNKATQGVNATYLAFLCMCDAQQLNFFFVCSSFSSSYLHFVPQMSLLSFFYPFLLKSFEYEITSIRHKKELHQVKLSAVSCASMRRLEESMRRVLPFCVCMISVSSVLPFPHIYTMFFLSSTQISFLTSAHISLLMFLFSVLA